MFLLTSQCYLVIQSAYHLTPISIASRGGQHPLSDTPKIASGSVTNLGKNSAQVPCLQALPLCTMPHCPTTSRVSPYALDVLTFPQPLKRLKGKRTTNTNYVLTQCINPHSSPPLKVKGTGLPKTPENPQWCSALTISLPSHPLHSCVKEFPGGQCQRDTARPKSSRQRCRSHSVSPKPEKRPAPARILFRVRPPGLCKAEQATAQK